MARAANDVRQLNPMINPGIGLITESLLGIVTPMVFIAFLRPELLLAPGLFVIAFVVGFREETFRALIKRVLDVILATGDKPAEQRVALVPAYLELTAQRGASVTRTVTLVNTTKDTFDLSGAMPVFDPEVIGLAVTLPDAGPVGPGQSALLTLTWQPIAASVSTETSLVIEVGGYRLTSVVRLTVVT